MPKKGYLVPRRLPERNLTPLDRIPREEEAPRRPAEPRFMGEEQVENAYAQRFQTLTSPQLQEYYAWQAEQVGLKFHPDQRLLSLIQADSTVIRYDTDSDPDTAVSLNADVPQQQLRIYFDDPTFIRKVSVSINGYRFLPGAFCGIDGPLPPPPSEPQVFTNFPSPGLDIRDHIYIDVSRPGSNQVFTEEPVSLTAFCGTGPLPYFWTPIPIVKRSGWLNFTVSILPPGQENWPQGPPFVRYVGWLQLQLHTEVFQPFGV